MPRLTEADKAAVSQALKHAKLVAASRKLARIVKHTDPAPEVCDARDLLEASLTDWMLRHGGEAFSSAFGPAHLRVIAKIDRAINHGGLFALAMPRGGGKSTILKWATLYCLLTGRRKYVVVVAATADLARAVLDFARQQIQESDSLHAHYPHVTTYARATEGKSIKARYQLRGDGKPSGIEWSKTALILADVDSEGQIGSDGAAVTRAEARPYPSNGAILEGHGLTGAIRGKWRDSRSGKVLRPDFVLLDDPQSRESAESESQCNMRERIISGDVLGLAGPKKRIAAVMPCTIIRKNDLADRFLDRAKHPEWTGEIVSLVEAWPAAQDTLWRDYAEIYRKSVAAGNGTGPATAFYAEHREAMDAGSVASWEDRIRDGEISAIQTAENLLLETGPQFWAEYQNAPLSLTPDAEYVLAAEDIRTKLNGGAQHAVPEGTVALTVGVDVNKYAAAFCCAAWSNQMTGTVIDYGWWLPKGQKQLWEDNAQKEKAVYAAVLGIIHDILKAKSYGAEVSALTVDAGFASQTVYDAVIAARKLYKHAHIYASRGLPGDKYDLPRQGANIFKRGYFADVRKAYPAGLILYWDSHHWHMETQRGWLCPVGSPGGCSLWGASGAHHSRFSEQASADKLQKTEISNGKTFATWHTNERNEMGDCISMAAALATTEGVSPTGQGRLTRKQREAQALELQEPPAKPETEGEAAASPVQDGRHVHRSRGSRGGWANRW